MPCKTGSPKQPDPNEPLQVSCTLDSGVGGEVVLETTAQDLLKLLDETRHIGDSSHPNRLELEAQRSLLRHAIRNRVKIRLQDDHWGRTGIALVRLFEDGKATIQSCGNTLQFANLVKENWRFGTNPLGSHGGFLYRDPSGNIVFKTVTWIS